MSDIIPYILFPAGYRPISKHDMVSMFLGMFVHTVCNVCTVCTVCMYIMYIQYTKAHTVHTTVHTVHTVMYTYILKKK